MPNAVGSVTLLARKSTPPKLILEKCILRQKKCLRFFAKIKWSVAAVNGQMI